MIQSKLRKTNPCKSIYLNFVSSDKKEVLLLFQRFHDIRKLN